MTFPKIEFLIEVLCKT